VSALRPEDCCHLNGLAVVDGQPRYVTAMAEMDSPAGWRARKHNGGCLIEVSSSRILVRGLSLPHSPRVAGDRIVFLHSSQGEIAPADARSGQVTPVAQLPGVARGLAIHGGFAFVGLSNARPSLEGVPIAAGRDQLQCGLWVIDLRTGGHGRPARFRHRGGRNLRRSSAVGVVSPYVSGPAAEQDTGQPLWTIPP
jgi:uncharacterized protein (TIGR03032 family)